MSKEISKERILAALAQVDGHQDFVVLQIDDVKSLLTHETLTATDIEDGIRMLLRRASESPGGATVEVLVSDLRTLWRDQMPAINECPAVQSRG